jgi:ArsR family metal-binding transcriptional regulator
MDKGEAMKLIEELNDLSSNFEKNKERMIEIAKVLLTEHYKYLPRKNKQ